MAITCANHGGRVRKGLGKRVYILTNEGTLKPGIVCPGCFNKAVPVVTPPPTTIPPPCATVGCQGLGEYCGDCMTRIADHNHELTVQNTVLGTRPKRFPALERAAKKKARG